MSVEVRRRLSLSIAVIVIIAAVWAKVRLEAGAALERAEEFERVQYTRLAITAYRHTIRWYSPGSAPVEAAVERLQELGDELRGTGKVELALECYRALRSGIFAIRSFYTPYEEYLPSLNTAIASLMAGQEGAVLGSANEKKRIQHHEALLGIDRAPNILWSLLATLGFFAWCVALLIFSQRGFDDESGRIYPKAAARWGGIVLVLLAFWTSALALA